MEGTRTYYDSENTGQNARRHETSRGGGTSVQGGSNPLVSETTVNTDDEISEVRQYETRQDQELWAGSHDLPRSTGIQASRSRVPVTGIAVRYDLLQKSVMGEDVSCI